MGLASTMTLPVLDSTPASMDATWLVETRLARTAVSLILRVTGTAAGSQRRLTHTAWTCRAHALGIGQVASFWTRLWFQLTSPLATTYLGGVGIARNQTRSGLIVQM